MKKGLALVIVLFISITSFAGDNLIGLTQKIKKEKDILDGGIYLLFGVGIPGEEPGNTIQSSTPIIQTEFGNQWMFYRTSNFGLGMNVSWLTLGMGFYENTEDESWPRVFIQTLKFGPITTIRLADKLALDAYINIIPLTLNIYESVSYGPFSQYAPGIKVRYKYITLGAEINGGYSYYNEISSWESSYMTRFFAGFKF